MKKFLAASSCFAVLLLAVLVAPDRLPAQPPRLDSITGENQANTGKWYGAPFIAIDIPTFTLTTATAPADVATVTLPANIGRYIVVGVRFEAISATGTVAASTLAVRTAAAGAGNLVIAASALTGVTAADLGIIITQTATGMTVNPGNTTTLTIRQTVDSGNAGTVAGTIILAPVR